MKNKQSKIDEMIAANEAPVTGSELLCEMLPLFHDYFVGEFACDEQGILYRMPNGQQFYITAREVQS